MPPKGRGRPPKGSGTSTECAPYTPAKKATPGKQGKGKATSTPIVPDVFQDLLAETLPTGSNSPERPQKRRKIASREERIRRLKERSSPEPPDSLNAQHEEEDDLEFEDVLVPKEEEHNDDSSEEDDFKLPAKLQQTAYRSDHTDDEDDDGDDIYNFDIDETPGNGEPNGDLELTLSKKPPGSMFKSPARRRKAISKDDRIIRLQTHKMHLLCLLSYVDRRNDWINDPTTQATLRKLMTEKRMLADLRPPEGITQFNHGEWLKRGLDKACKLWRSKYTITARGMRRALWAEDDEDLENYTTPDDMNTIFDLSDFREAAKKLNGSRDLGAQLFCAMLRSVDVEARLVCSLQPLSFNAGGPPMVRATRMRSKSPKPEPSQAQRSTTTQVVDHTDFKFATPGASTSSTTPLTARQRLGHPNAAAYEFPQTSAPIRNYPNPGPEPEPFEESPYPIFWIEVFDSAHHKWLPVDPLVTESVAKAKNFEPPTSDRENAMSYVIAFEEDGTARDVTRRYAKAYNAKTRKNRVHATPTGQKWWRRAMKRFARGFITDADQVEDAEFAAQEAREPMPKNIQDFKDHPYYALERHLRRNEILVATKEIGKVAAGRDTKAPGGKKMESVYRRKDVKVARSDDAWYRLGRAVKHGEKPIKTVAAKRKAGDVDGFGEEAPGTDLFTEEQTELYVNPPVVNGLVPKNRFGNIEIFVRTMMPEGGVHIPYTEAVFAAKILGIDFSEALTGWEFRGRNGTPVIQGVVVAADYQEAVLAVIQGFREEKEREEEMARGAAVERMWRRMLMGLRIKQRIDTYAVEGEKPDFVPAGAGEVDSDGSVYDDDDGGGFVPDGDDMGGGFMPE